MSLPLAFTWNGNAKIAELSPGVDVFYNSSDELWMAFHNTLSGVVVRVPRGVHCRCSLLLSRDSWTYCSWHRHFENLFPACRAYRPFHFYHRSTIFNDKLNNAYAVTVNDGWINACIKLIINMSTENMLFDMYGQKQRLTAACQPRSCSCSVSKWYCIKGLAN